MSARISGTVRCVELPDGPVAVSAFPGPVREGAPAAQVGLAAGATEFTLEVPPGSWWIEAALEQSGVPGARVVSAWSHDPVEVPAGGAAEGVEIVLEVPETVR